MYRLHFSEQGGFRPSGRDVTPALALATPDSSVGVHTGKVSKFARGLAKIGIRSSKTSSR